MSDALTVALIAALLGFGGAWKIQDWRADAKENERVEQTLADQRQAAAVSIRRADNVIQAQNNAATRLERLRMDAIGARAALVSLSDAAGEALRASAASHNACIDRATALRYVLDQCGKEYQALGERADRHTSDLRTLMESWPK